MKRIKEIVLIILIGIILTPSALVWGQMPASDQAYKNKLESILSSFKNYRYSNISIYELDIQSLADLKLYDKAKQGAAAGGGVEAFDEKAMLQRFKDNQDLKDASGHYGDKEYAFIKDQARNQVSKNDILREMMMTKGWSQASMEDVEATYNYWKNADANQKKLEHVYVLTGRANNQDVDPTLGAPIPSYIISAMFVYTKDDNVNTLNDVGIKDIYTEPELKEVLPEAYAKILKDTNMYNYFYKFFLQGSVKDVTLEAQGIGSTIKYARPRAGQVTNLETSIDYLDLQTSLRISEGQPLEMKAKRNEVIVASDLLSWRRFDYTKYDKKSAQDIIDAREELAVTKQYYEDAKKKAATDPNNKAFERTASTAKDDYEALLSDTKTNVMVNNIAPPVIGFELKYGIEALGYPSLWSERATARAVWNGVKLGCTLPTNGWSGVSDNVADKRLTYTDGIGVSAAFDFAVPVIPESGIFQMNVNYVGGDAKQAGYNDDIRKSFKLGYDELGNEVNTDPVKDFVIRYDAQLFYTFALAIDENYKFRFGLGATVYGAEAWSSTPTSTDFERTLLYEKRNTETVGGLTMKADFMVSNSSTPWGATLQYFDSGLYGDIWMQVPVVENMFSIRLDAKGFFKAFDDPRAWENESVVIPSVRFIMFF